MAMKKRNCGHPPRQTGDAGPLKDLLLDLAAKLISVAPSEVGTEVVLGLRAMGEICSFDAATLAVFSDASGETGDVYYFAPIGIDGPFMSGADDMPWLTEKVCSGEIASIASLGRDLPESARKDKEYGKTRGIRSVLGIPLKLGDSIRGRISVFSLHGECDWSDELVRGLAYAGEVFINVLERRSTGGQINELMRFEHLLSEISATYINIPVDAVEKVIKNDLERLGRLMGAQRCLLYLAGEDKRSFKYGPPFIWWTDEDSEIFVHDSGFQMAMDGKPGSADDFFGDLKYLFEKWAKGEQVQFADPENLPVEAERMKRFYVRFGVKSLLSIPISVAGSVVAALVIATTRNRRIWPEDLIPRLRLFGEVFANAIARKRAEESLQNALSEVRNLKERFEKDYKYLREEINLEHDFREVVGKSDVLRNILVKVKQVAPTNAIVLILGETGTGKGLMARAVHNASTRNDRPLVQVNCATLTPTLIESELFGYEKGAFTGAQARRIGRFEVAQGTTLFLDEIGELPPELQAKLLRVLQDGEFERVGGNTTIKTDVRVIAATNKDLAKEVEAGRFRRDLWYRLNIFPIYVPPLRERIEDIPLFVSFFVEKYCKRMGKKFDMVSQRTLEALQGYAWPGNIRELENVIERAIITSTEGSLQIEVPACSEEKPFQGRTMEQLEKEYILETLRGTGWIIEGPRGAAFRLGLNHGTLRSRMKKLGIRRPQ